jgi:hypothetical protein
MKKENIANKKAETKMNTTNNKEKSNQPIINNVKQQNVKNETKNNAGINFDNLNDWGNIVYPNEQNINEYLNKLENIMIIKS